MTEEKPKVEKNPQQIIAERRSKQDKSSQKDKDKAPVPKKQGQVNWALRTLLLLVIFLLGAGATVYFLPVLKDRIPVLAQWVGPAPSNDSGFAQNLDLLAQNLDLLERRVARHEDNITALQNKKVNAVSSAPDSLLLERLDSLEQAALQAKEDKQKSTEDISQSARIDMLLGRMSQLEASFVPLSKGLSDAQTARIERAQLAAKTTSHSDILGQIEYRLRKVEDYAGRDNNGALLAFRLGELRRKVTSGADFGPEIDKIKNMTAQGTFAANVKIHEALDWLNQHKGGIATKAGLRDQFDGLIPDMIRAGTSQSGDPWWKRAYDSTKNLIMVRKTDSDLQNTDEGQNIGHDIGHDMDSIIASAHQMLERFDLKSGLALLKELPDNIRETLDIWIMQAEIYLRAEDELDQIESLTAAYYLDAKAPAQLDVGPKNGLNSGEETDL